MSFAERLWPIIFWGWLAVFSIELFPASCQAAELWSLDEAVDKILQSADLRRDFTPEECYTPYFLEVKQHWNLLSPEQRERLGPFFLRPNNPESPYFRQGGLPLVYDTRHFRCHYTIAGEYGVPAEDTSPADGVPDYVQIAADAYEKTYAVVVEQMGYNTPPDDWRLSDNGGDEKWDIYFFTGPWGGFTMPEYMVDLQSSTCATFSVFFAANTRYFQWGGKFKGGQSFQCTSAHEFFHAVQMNYNGYMYRWLMEACAMWIETRVFKGEEPGEPDGQEFCLRPMISWFLSPEKSLELFNGQHEYGNVIFMFYLTEKYGDQIVQGIYQAMVPRMYSYLMNFREVFRESDPRLDLDFIFASEFKEFTLWNALTDYRYGLEIREPSGELSQRFHYAHGERYPPVAMLEENTHAQYPVKVVMDSRRSPEHLGARYVRFLPQQPGQKNRLSIRVDGDDIRGEELGLLYELGFCGWGARLLEIDWDTNTAVAEEIIPFPISQDGQLNIDGFGDPIDEVILVLSNLDPEQDGGTVSYSADLTPDVGISELSVDTDDNGMVTLNWVSDSPTKTAGFRVMRKNARFGPFESEELYRSAAEENRGDDYFFFGALPLAELLSDHTSFTDSTALLGPMMDESVYYYGVVPFTEEGILGRPTVTAEFVAPVDLTAPTGSIVVQKAGSSVLEIDLVVSEHLPLNRAPVLSCTLPDGSTQEIRLQSADESPLSYGSRLWRGVLNISTRMPSGEITLEGLLVDRRENSGPVNQTYLWETRSLPAVLVYPNPFSGDDENVTFDVSTEPGQQVKVRIFTMAGELVRDLTGGALLYWDGKNTEGKRVAEGVYFYTIETAAGTVTGKIVVVH